MPKIDFLMHFDDLKKKKIWIVKRKNKLFSVEKLLKKHKSLKEEKLSDIDNNYNKNRKLISLNKKLLLIIINKHWEEQLIIEQ